MANTHAARPASAPHYFVPDPSQYPFAAGAALLVWAFGMAGWVNNIPLAGSLAIAGTLGFLLVLYFWFGRAIKESEGGLYSKRVDVSYRWSMSWFIFSEVMFFAAFFGALFYARGLAMPWLADPDYSGILWPDFRAVWPNTGPQGNVEPFATVGPFWLPTINTALLLTSGVTLTLSHHALRASHRTGAIVWLLATVLLGATFMGVQAYEYCHAYTELNLKLTSGIYGSTFFLLTGFHGFHVCMGAIMLSVVLYRLIKGHFTAEQHFAFEGAAWYWHFVDVVWLGLYILVYWM